MMVETKDPGEGDLEREDLSFEPETGDESEASGDEDEDGDEEVVDVMRLFNPEKRLWWFKWTVNVIFPIIWIGLGGYYAEAYFVVYYKDDDGGWSDAGGGTYNDVDRSVINFTITALFLFSAGLLVSGVMAYLKLVTYRKYLEMAICVAIVAMGLICMFAFGETTNDFYWSTLNAWAIATVGFAGFLLIYHISVYIDYLCPCCCRGDTCCDWDYEFKEETDSELDRLESLDIHVELEDVRDKIQEQKMDHEYAQKMKRRAEKKERRRAREIKRKERRKRKAEKLLQERKEFEAYKLEHKQQSSRFYIFC